MNQFVIANSRDCLGCRACEVACVLSHNEGQFPVTEALFQPRIHVVRHDKGATAVACHHCEDAPCANACPVAAIHYDNGTVQLNQAECIGCRNCVIACPFGAMAMVETAEQTMLAQKCDLCVQHAAGPACVDACPTGALALLDSVALVQLRRAKQLNTTSGRVTPEAPRYGELHQQIAALTYSPRKVAEKSPLTDRQQSFIETYHALSAVQVTEQASRCLSCSDKPHCQWRCPLHNQIPDWLQLAAAGDVIGAATISNYTSSLPEICGRVCPQDKLCEGGCTLKPSHGAVTIGNIERYINDQALAQGWRPELPLVPSSGRRVAIIGSGPAGLGCADVLLRHGVQPVVFERQPEIGGMLTFGIPSFKLAKTVVQQRRALFSDMGIEFQLNTEVGTDITIEQLLAEFDAVFVGAGTYLSMRAGLDNEQAPGVYEALPYLTANTKHLMGLPQQDDAPYVNLAAQRVVVLGGGDTAMDCLRTAVRQQAASVICAYRRDEANMPGSVKEVANAKEEGAEFLFNVQPTSILCDDDGRLRAVQFVRTELGEPDASGRRRPQVVAGSEFELAADALIIAFGFSAHSMPWLVAAGVELNRWGLIEACATSRYPLQTSHPKIFAGGDIVRGADLVVTAMADGRLAAKGIVAALGL